MPAVGQTSEARPLYLVFQLPGGAAFTVAWSWLLDPHWDRLRGHGYKRRSPTTPIPQSTPTPAVAVLKTKTTAKSAFVLHHDVNRLHQNGSERLDSV